MESVGLSIARIGWLTGLYNNNSKKKISIEHCADDRFQWKHMAIFCACFRLAPSLCSAFVVFLHRWLHFTCSALFGFSIVSLSFYALDLLHRLKGKRLHCSRCFKNLEWNRIEDKRFKSTWNFMILMLVYLLTTQMLFALILCTIHTFRLPARRQPTDKFKWNLNFEWFFFRFSLCGSSFVIFHVVCKQFEEK